MELFFQQYPESYLPNKDSAMPLVIVPGLFGSTTNWRGLGRKLGEHLPVIVVDQRNHGKSPHADSNNYFDMASDLLEFIDYQGIDRINLCGHSMGGKVAMVFSLLYPQRVESLVVLDIAPTEYVHSHAPYLEKMMSIELKSLESRSAADKKLIEAIPDTSTRLFLLQSLVGSRGSFEWRLNLPVLLRDMPKITSFPSELSELSNRVQSLFISGEQSNYLTEANHSQILEYFPSASFMAISSAGHWLHAEQPQAVLMALLNFLQKGKKK